ncbi:hypothetical protein NJ76_27775 [Rhodococcus sp. IITR03]|nr:hypothetical protein NJ76_27775 [Rhodococcus sp. IITR03]
MNNDQTDDFFVIDAPLAEGDEENDLLERRPFAKQVAKRIAQAGTHDSVVFGLAGPWGAGKTSALTLIRKELHNLQRSWVVVDFTPWLPATSWP